MKKFKIRPMILGFLSAGVILTGLPAAMSASTYSDKAWSAVLKKHLFSSGRVDYTTVKKDTQPLKDYLDEVRSVAPEEYEQWSKEERIAFWINTYNAVVIKVVSDHYPIKRSGPKGLLYPEQSIQQIPNVWDEKRVSVLGQELSLNDIEHKILRKEFAEPRIHFALVCASLGCPTLRAEPYTAGELNSQLDGQVREFLSDKSKVRYDGKTDTLWLSPIFKWFREDFEKAGGIIAFLQTQGKRYLPPDIEGKVNLKTKISWLGYDWSLNDSSIS